MAAEPSTWQEQEAQLVALHDEAEAGCFDETSKLLADYLISQLPEGYVIDEDARVVRLNPDLPDHVFIDSMVNGLPSGRQVRVPAYAKGLPASDIGSAIESRSA